MGDSNNASGSATKLIDINGLQTYTSHVEQKNVQCTLEQYNALPSTKETDGKTYFITDEGYTIKNGITYGEIVEIEYIQSDWDITDPTSDAYIKNKPTSLSAFTNDQGFITNTVNDLTNYYTKSTTYTRSEVNALLSAIPKFNIEVVDSLLIADPSPTTVYLLLNSSASTRNLYTEYLYIVPETGEPFFEKIGEQAIDLSSYYTSSQVDTLLDGKANSADLGSAAYKSVDSSISSGSTSQNLPTSAAVASYVASNGGVLNVSEGISDGTIRINTNGVITDVAVKNIATQSDITNLQSNFQDGVDSVYNAVIARGTTPSSHTLSDVVDAIGDIETTHTTTYTPTSRASNNDMGATHYYRYVDTTSLPNANSGTYDVSSNGTKDMGATNDKRYVNVNVPNSNSGTYSFPENDTGSIKDLGAANDKRYVVASNVYTKGWNDGKSDHSTTYTPTSRASNNDMGKTHSYRYVNTNSVPNSNSGTYDVTSNGIKDMGNTNDKRYLNVSVPNSNSGTYTFAQNDTGGIKDMGATNSNRYVIATNVYNKGKADGKADHSTTYTPTARASNNDMGSTHSYRYVNTNSVPNSNSGTATYDSNGVKDMGSTNSYRYVNVNRANSNSGTYTYPANSTGSTTDLGSANTYRYVNAGNVYTKGWNDGKADHSATYTPTSRASNNDMGASHSYRYVNTNSVPNSNSGTYGSVTSNGIKDMGATNSYRYVNVNVPNSNSGTATYDSNGIKDMGTTNSYRYLNINVPFSTVMGTYIGCTGMQAITSSRTITRTYNDPAVIHILIAQTAANMRNATCEKRSTYPDPIDLGTDPTGNYGRAWLSIGSFSVTITVPTTCFYYGMVASA